MIDVKGHKGYQLFSTRIFYLGCFGKIFSRLRHRAARRTDARVNLMSEIINGIKVIKMYTWEKPFARLISSARKSEIRAIRKNAYFKSFNMGFFFVSHKLVMMAILGVYSFVEEKRLNASDTFLTLSLYYLMSLILTRYFTRCTSLLAECQVSMKRIQKFLELDEIHRNDNFAADETTPPFSLEVKNVFLHWNNDQQAVRSNDALIDISLTVQSSQLCAVIGEVGSGKSTLLNAVIGELPINEGRIKIPAGAKIGYASQTPWIFSSTVRQNIIFNQLYDENRYRKVIRVTALDADIDAWDDGDDTLVGDRGIILSGGQKARINLARCIYRNADIYLLDDPLSAVDAHVGKHIYESCIRGFLGEKAVVLVTHQIHYLKDADEIVVLRNGAISSRGTYGQLLESGNLIITPATKSHNEVTQKANDWQLSKKKAKKKNLKMEQQVHKKKKKKNHFNAYKKFFAAGGNIYTWTLLIISHILTQTLYTASDIYIGNWVNEEENGTSNTTQNFLIFSLQILGIIIFSAVRTFLHFLICLKSAESLHNAMFSKILYTHSRFFDVNPVGKILNRFSKDLGAVDDLLPLCMFDVCAIFGIVIGTFAIAIFYNPILIPPILVNVVIFYYLCQYYLASSRPAKMLESSTKTPIFSQLSSTFDGLLTVRTSQGGQKLIAEFDQKQDLHSSSYLAFFSLTKWLTVALDCAGIVFWILCVLSFILINGKFC